MEAISSYLEEEHDSKYKSEEEEEDQSGVQEDDAPLKEESCVQKQQSSWSPMFFYRMDREVYHFVGQDILIQDGLDSYAANTWPGSLAICKYLERHSKEMNLVDKAVLEIGAGTGLAAIVAALLGAWVTATDLPDALSNLRANLSRNTRGRSRHTPQVAALPWSFNLESTYPTSVYHYDYVLAADVAYHHNFFDELLATMKHFCQPGTTLLWANKMRFANDREFAVKFKKTFNTKLLVEDGEIKLFMATYREDGGEMDTEVEDVLQDDEVESRSEVEVRNDTEKIESVAVQCEEEPLTDNRNGEETEDDEEKGSNVENVEVNRREEESELSDSIEKTEDEEEEDEDHSDEDMTEEPTDSIEDTQGEQTKSLTWTPSIISRFNRDLYQYVGTDIDIHESIDSYGAVMWPAALALCSFLENNRDMVNLEDKNVLELGAGTGLVTIVASLLGARVTATDLPDILGNLRANVMRNTRGRTRHLPQVWPLIWSFALGHTYPSPLHRFDFVLAADVVYHHDYLDELLATMVQFCHPRTTIILANKIRMESDKTFIEKFKKEFNTTMLAEDGDMKIMMGKFRM
ncbi:uncharacterized protein mettl21ca isoform X2 [Eucyclogobius newberryi]|uniref:uncharacterized protein mettl21ca isoform X2 n=1 Tax=Eucyclogobius newberryi TaxID=166745 RepID=UPI003B5C0130